GRGVPGDVQRVEGRGRRADAVARRRPRTARRSRERRRARLGRDEGEQADRRRPGAVGEAPLADPPRPRRHHRRGRGGPCLPRVRRRLVRHRLRLRRRRRPPRRLPLVELARRPRRAPGRHPGRAVRHARGAAVRIEHVALTFLNLPLVRPEGWVWGRRDSYTVGLVELHTDAGITGIGEVNVCMGPNPEVIRAMTEQMAELFVGDTPLAPQRLVSRVLGAGWYPFHRTAALVLGGLEMACFDAAGKHLGQPVSTFFGGPLKTVFPSMYYVQAQDDLDAMVAQARDAVARGFGTI